MLNAKEIKTRATELPSVNRSEVVIKFKGRARSGPWLGPENQVEGHFTHRGTLKGTGL